MMLSLAAVVNSTGHSSHTSRPVVVDNVLGAAIATHSLNHVVTPIVSRLSDGCRRLCHWPGRLCQEQEPQLEEKILLHGGNLRYQHYAPLLAAHAQLRVIWNVADTQ